MNVFVLAGVLGFGFYALSFGLVQLQRLDGNGTRYTFLNLVAAALVLTSMAEQFNLGSLLTQVTWIGAGLVGLYRRIRPSESIEVTATNSHTVPRTSREAEFVPG